MFNVVGIHRKQGSMGQKSLKAVRKNPPIDMLNGPDSFVLLVGAMKCGTTSLYASLTKHPDICPCVEKEPGFFSQLDLPLPQYNEETFHSYQSLWPAWDPEIHKIAIEASTGYSKYPQFPNAARRIKRLKNLTGAQFKIIYIMRDPVDLATSFYRHAMTDIHWGKPTVKRLFDEGKLSKGLRIICSYAKQLNLYYRHFNRQNILILHFEDLVEHSEIALTKICDFLELDQSSSWKPSLVHTHSSQKRITDFFEHHAEHVYPGLTPEKMLEWKLSDVHRKRIRNWVKDDIQILKEKYNIDTSHWTY